MVPDAQTGDDDRRLIAVDAAGGQQCGPVAGSTTVPDVSPSDAVTVAVNVTGVPAGADVRSDVSAVVVAACTVCARITLVGGA